MSVTASKLTAFPALLVHLATSIWMLGNRAIFSSAINEKGNALVSKAYQPIDDLDLMSAIANKITQKHVLPLTILFALLTLFWLVSVTLRDVTKALGAAINFLTCGGARETEEALDVLNEFEVDYSVACDRGIIKGIPSYNILENPCYQEHFAIDRQFARMHQHVASVLGFEDRLGRRSSLQPGAKRRATPTTAPSQPAAPASQGGQGRQGRRLSSTTPGIPPPPSRDNPVNHVIRESFDWDGQHPNQQLRSATSERVITDNCVL